MSLASSRELLDRPTVPGALLAMLAGVAAVRILIEGAGQWQALVVDVVGLALCAGGYVAWRRGQQVAGALSAIAGGVLVLVALALAVSQPEAMTERLELLPGLLGLAVLLAGLLPVRSSWERRLVSTGAALLFVGVVTSGVVRGPRRSSCWPPASRRCSPGIWVSNRCRWVGKSGGVRGRVGRSWSTLVAVWSPELRFSP